MDNQEPRSLIINLSLGFRNPNDVRRRSYEPVRQGQGSGGDVQPGWGVENNVEN